MIIDKVVSLQAPIEQVWDTILDVEALARCFPGLERIEQLDEKTYKSTIKVSVAHISAKFDLVTRITDMQPLMVLATVTEGKAQAMGATVTQKQTLELKSTDPGSTQVTYRGDVLVTGPLAIIGQRVIRAKAEQISDAFTASFVGLLQKKFASGGKRLT